RLAARWLVADLLAAPALTDATRWSWIVLFGVLHHVPGAARRRALLCDLARRLAPGGVLAVSLWRFRDDPRQRRKCLDEAAVRAAGIDPQRLEPGDHLLSFHGDRRVPRFACHIDAAEARAYDRALADGNRDGGKGVGLIRDAAFDDEDGLNHYRSWRHPGRHPATVANFSWL
ncbi:MAG: hypothetical protein AAF772_10900, partial [Acidobacteriota bacterium]